MLLALTQNRSAGGKSLTSPLVKMAGATGFEPATSGVTGRRSDRVELRPLAD